MIDIYILETKDKRKINIYWCYSKWTQFKNLKQARINYVLISVNKTLELKLENMGLSPNSVTYSL